MAILLLFPEWQWKEIFVIIFGTYRISGSIDLEVKINLCRKDEKRQYEFFDNTGKVRRVRRDRENAPGANGPNRGGRGGPRKPRPEGTNETPASTPAQ